jgi:exopolysaccharide production protein ExoQ
VYGIASTGEWKGVFGQKNHLGLCMAFAFSGLPFCGFRNGLGLLKIISLAVLPIGLIFLSHSRTSLILVAILVAVRIIGPLIVRAQREQLPFLLYSVFAGLATVGLAATVGRDTILSALGRDTTLTGRTEHWAILGTFALRHLWLGYGYQAFWTNHGDALSAMNAIGAAMTGSDSGYLDTLLQFGVVGIGMMVIVLLVSSRDFLRLLRRSSVPLLAFWYAGLILTVYVGSITEGLFPGTGGFSTFVFVVACAALRNLSEQGRLSGLAGPDSVTRDAASLSQ